MERIESAIEEGLPLKPFWVNSMRVEKRPRRKGGEGGRETGGLDESEKGRSTGDDRRAERD